MKSRLFIVGAFLVVGCSEPRLQPPAEFYYPAWRQSPPAPVYSRVTWSHSPRPIATALQSDDSPLLSPRFSFELGESNLQEAVHALASALGYRTQVPAEVAGRKVSIKFVGTADEAIKEISKQAGVVGEIDSQQQIVRIKNPRLAPRLKTGAR